MTNGTKIVSAIYELKYVKERNSGVYKNYGLLVETLKNVIFPEYNYVIYTNNYTCAKYNLKTEFNFPNVEIKFNELNTSSFCALIDNIRQIELSKGMNYDRIYCIDNYLEVILNKIKFLIDESNDCENVFWLDSGLMGTSCHDGWRDYMRPLVNSKNFLDKVVEKINEYGFIHLKGNNIQLNYELVNNFSKEFNINLKLVPGGLFGGKSTVVREVLDGYDTIFKTFVENYRILISEQEVLSVLTTNKQNKCYAFQFNDWLDLQKGLLNILDIYDESRYQTEKCYN